MSKNKNYSQSLFHIPLICLLFFNLSFMRPSTTQNISTLGIPVGGPIIEDTTWLLANSPYIVIQNVDVLPGKTLTIEPGVIVKFNPGLFMLIEGGLVANGTPSSQIYFTTNQSNPTVADWTNIEFSSTAIITTVDASQNYVSGSILRNCVIEYGGKTNGGMNIALVAHSLLVDQCTFRNNSGTGIAMVGTTLAPGIIRNSIFYNNKGNIGGGINASGSIITNNQVYDNLSSGYGGGIYSIDSIVKNNVINNNTAYGDGGGIYGINSDVINNTITKNYLPQGHGNSSGAGIYGERINVIGNYISENRSIGSDKKGGGIFLYDNGQIKDNIIRNNLIDAGPYSSNTYGGGIYVELNYAESPEVNILIDHNIILENENRSLYVAGGGGIAVRAKSIANAEVIISNNFISRNHTTCQSMSFGGGLYTSYQYTKIINNTITFNSVSGPSVNGSGVLLSGINVNENFLNNTLIGNYGPLNSLVGGIELDGPVNFHANTIYLNHPYDATKNLAGDVDATNNYWAKSTVLDIMSGIYDWYDNANLGKIIIAPYLQTPDPTTPVAPPTDLKLNILGNDGILTWTPLPNSTAGFGYKIYFNPKIPGPPYYGTGLPQGNSPIDVGNVTQFTLEGVKNGAYFITVTAYDNLGHESWYSNEVSYLPHVYLPLLRK